MNPFLKIAYNHGAQQAIADLEKLAAPNLYEAILRRYNAPKAARKSMTLGELMEGPGVTGLGFGGDLGLAAAAGMGAFGTAEDWNWK